MSIKSTSLRDRCQIKRALVVIMIFVTMAAAPAVAHVALDAPNGGEILEPDSVVSIVWHDEVYHGPANYDLWYSTTGSEGPWIEIVADITPGSQMPSYSYDWVVPNTPSDQVRVRVRQENEGTDYVDVSDSDIIIAGESDGNVVVLEPAGDATLYEGDGTLANGAGSYLFTGATEGQNDALERRALLVFDIESSVPVGATITMASLDLTMSRTVSGPQTVELRRVGESWGEGPSDPTGQEGGGAAAENGDATWLHRTFSDNFWGTEGGSFAGSASGSAEIDDTGPYTFESTSGMVSDVQSWLDDPENNHGWALVIPSPPEGSAKRFNSRENSSASSRPQLMIEYEGGSVPITSRVFIPAAAHVSGAGGSFFVTTVDVHNPGSATASFSFEWLPRNTDNSTPVESAEYSLAAGETRRFHSFLEDVFGITNAAGASAVRSDTEGLEVMSRTFNQTADGTFGQSLTGIPEGELIQTGRRALVLFLTEDGTFRSNLGLVNGVSQTITVRWEFFASDGSLLGTGSIALPPWGNRQLNRVLADFAPIEAAYAHIWTNTAGGAFTCYGSVLDELTSDPTTVPPR